MLKDGAKDHRKTFLNWKRCPIESIEAKLEFGENVPHSIGSEVPMYIERACVASVAYHSNPRSEYTFMYLYRFAPVPLVACETCRELEEVHVADPVTEYEQ